MEEKVLKIHANATLWGFLVGFAFLMFVYLRAFHFDVSGLVALFVQFLLAVAFGGITSIIAQAFVAPVMVVLLLFGKK